MEGNEALLGWAIFVLSYARTRMIKLEGLRRAGQTNPDEPRLHRFCLLSHYPILNPFPEKQGRQLQRAHELINNPCQRSPGLHRVVLDICRHDYICQQPARAACRELTVAGPWGVKNQFITLITKLCISNSAKYRQCILPSTVRCVPLCRCFLVYHDCTLFYPVKHFIYMAHGQDNN